MNLLHYNRYEPRTCFGHLLWPLSRWYLFKGCVQRQLSQCNKFIYFLKNKNQLDATYYLIVLLIGSTCFRHYCAHHQELGTIMLITTLVISFLVCLVCKPIKPRTKQLMW